MRTTSLVLAVALAACGDNQPAPDDNTAPPPADGRTITGSQVLRYRTLDGQLLSEQPVDLWDVIVEAHSPDGDGWRVHPGIAHRDGSFAIEHVPDGAFWLRVARRPFGEAFYWTSADHISFDEDSIGPELPTSASEGDQLALAVDGLASWQEDDGLAWFVPEDIVFDMNLVAYPPPAPDTTELATSIDWAGRALADVGANEPAFLIQYRTQDVGEGVEVRVRAPLRAARPVIHQVAGVTSTIDVTLEAPEVLPYYFAWARDLFENERSAIHPTRAGASMLHGFSISANPAIVDGDYGFGSEYPVAYLADPSLLEGTNKLDLGTLAIPNPFPREWLTDLHVVTFPVDYPLPDGTPMTLEAVIGGRSTDVTRTTPVTPMITPIRAPRLAGQDAFTEVGGVGLTPELTWTAPATGTATSYRLQIIEAVENPPEPYRPGWYLTAELVVPGDVTSLRIPADVLRKGATYGIVVRSFAQPGQDVATTPFRSRASAGFADAVLGPFTP